MGLCEGGVIVTLNEAKGLGPIIASGDKALLAVKEIYRSIILRQDAMSFVFLETSTTEGR